MIATGNKKKRPAGELVSVSTHRLSNGKYCVLVECTDSRFLLHPDLYGRCEFDYAKQHMVLPIDGTVFRVPTKEEAETIARYRKEIDRELGHRGSPVSMNEFWTSDECDGNRSWAYVEGELQECFKSDYLSIRLVSEF